MKKFLHISGRFLALVVMTALVLRPVVVSAQKASFPQFRSFSAHSPAPSWTGPSARDQAYAKAGSFAPLRTLQTERQDPLSLGPCASKPMVFQALHEVLSPHCLRPFRSDLRTVQVLRI